MRYFYDKPKILVVTLVLCVISIGITLLFSNQYACINGGNVIEEKMKEVTTEDFQALEMKLKETEQQLKDLQVGQAKVDADAGTDAGTDTDTDSDTDADVDTNTDQNTIINHNSPSVDLLKDPIEQRGQWIGDQWVPPESWKIFSSLEIREFYTNTSIQTVGDSTMRRSGMVLKNIVSASALHYLKYLNETKGDDIMDEHTVTVAEADSNNTSIDTEKPSFQMLKAINTPTIEYEIDAGRYEPATCFDPLWSDEEFYKAHGIPITNAPSTSPSSAITNAPSTSPSSGEPPTNSTNQMQDNNTSVVLISTGNQDGIDVPEPKPEAEAVISEKPKPQGFLCRAVPEANFKTGHISSSCQTQMESYIASEYQVPFYTRHTDIIVFGLGVWEGMNKCVEKYRYTYPTLHTRVMTTVMDFVHQNPHITFLWRTSGYHRYKIGQDQINTVNQFAIDFIQNYTSTYDIRNMAIVHWGAAIEERSERDNRLMGDIDAHYNHLARTVFVQMMTNVLQDMKWREP